MSTVPVVPPSPTLAPPPTLTIMIGIEGPVTLCGWAANESEQIRFMDWLESSPDRWKLVCLAMDLASEPKAAA